MKKLLLLTLLFFSFSVYSQEKKTWDYPVKPGSEKWASFTSGQQMLEACQIPKEVLAIISTKELAEICLNYPLLNDYIYVNDARNGISMKIEMFNGLKELSERKDCFQELFNIYKNYPILTQIQNKDSKDYHVPYKLPFLELLIADDAIIKKLDDQSLSALGKIVIEKYEKKLENSHVYSLFNMSKTFLLGAVIIVNQNINSISPEQKDIAKRFIDNSNNPEPALLSEISKVISELL